MIIAIINISLLFSNLNVLAIEGVKEPLNTFQNDDIHIQVEVLNSKKMTLKYTVSNIGEKEIQNLSLKHISEEEKGIHFIKQSFTINGKKLIGDEVDTFYKEEKLAGSNMYARNIQGLHIKSKESIDIVIGAKELNKEQSPKVIIEQNGQEVGHLFIQNKVFTEEKGTKDEKEQKIREEDKEKTIKEEKQKGREEDKEQTVKEEKQEIREEDKEQTVKEEKQEVREEDKEQTVKEEKQEIKEENKEKLEVVEEKKQDENLVFSNSIPVKPNGGFDTPIYEERLKGNLVQTGNVTLGLEKDRYTRGSMGRRTDKYIVNVDNDKSTFNSSTGVLPPVPQSGKVKKAYLFWTAAMGAKGYLDGKSITDLQIQQPVKIKSEDGSYKDVFPNSIRKEVGLPYIGSYFAGYNGDAYVAYADVTNAIEDYNLNKPITVANIPQLSNTNGTGYYWGNWNLIVVYEDPKETVKDMQVWEGLITQRGYDWTHINIKNINTPKEGNFKAKFSYYASNGTPAENDVYGKDYATYDFGKGKVNVKNHLGNAEDANDGSMTEIQTDGTNELVTKKYKGYNPDWTNSFATDIHTYHLEGPNQIANNLKDGKISFKAYNAAGNIYTLNNVTFVAEYDSPNLIVTKKMLNTEGQEINSVKAGQEFLYRIEIKNNVSNPLAKALGVQGYDKLDDYLEYIPNSITHETHNGVENRTDQQKDDQVDVIGGNEIKYRIGKGANAERGGTLDVGAKEAITFKVRVKPGSNITEVKNTAYVSGKDVLNNAIHVSDSVTGHIVVPDIPAGDLRLVSVPDTIAFGELTIPSKPTIYSPSQINGKLVVQDDRPEKNAWKIYVKETEPLTLDGKEQLIGAMRYVKGSQQYTLGETAVEVAASISTNNEPTEVAWNEETNGIRLFIEPSPLIKVGMEYKGKLEWVLADTPM
ncbi:MULTISPECIES: isopeptide-forming domain-containing fimbrial protein [Bacillus]|uniref:isopeptide-forming domain-containing fimbrial protein n=1 Tax=Bacillus TaxID=1386 RepID=UPI001CEFAC7B|nr:MULTISPECIES: isopeptide-forming domain-containing fimbrial protein [Bacillus]